jgi:putative transposase
MTTRDHLQRLPPEHYHGQSIVHWSLTIRDRRAGWLNGIFYYRFRELLTHTAFRYGIACPIFCLMPDHFHQVWMGLFDDSDQLLAMKHFRKSVNESLVRIEHKLQDQAYDHVLRDDERQEGAFREVCEYVARNPERAGLAELDGYKDYCFTGCLIPGYPQLRPFEPDFWNEFGRVISFIRKDGLVRQPKPNP